MVTLISATSATLLVNIYASIRAIHTRNETVAGVEQAYLIPSFDADQKGYLWQYTVYRVKFLSFHIWHNIIRAPLNMSFYLIWNEWKPLVCKNLLLCKVFRFASEKKRWVWEIAGVGGCEVRARARVTLALLEAPPHPSPPLLPTIQNQSINQTDHQPFPPFQKSITYWDCYLR